MCAAGGEPCVVTVKEDGTATSTGGKVTARLTVEAQGVVDRDTRTTQRADAQKYILAAVDAVAGIGNESTETELTSAQEDIDTAKDKVNAATALSESERERLLAQVTAQQTILDGKETTRTAHMEQQDADERKQMATTARHLYAALGGPTAADNALDNATGIGFDSSGGFQVNAVAGAGALPDATNPDLVTLKAGEAAESLGDWSGRHYAHTDSGTKVKNEALVYSNQADPEVMTFQKWADSERITIATTPAADKGSISVDTTSATTLAPVDVEAFKHSGTKVHSFASGSSEIIVPGTYNGAPGRYRCTGATCSSKNDGEGSPLDLEGTWRFFPDEGAMVSVPDTDYLYYGWWLSKDKDGMPTAATAFYGYRGSPDPDSGWATAIAARAIAGSATYTGNAAGKFAMHNLAERTGNSGHFTADAEITMKFGAITDENDNGVTGTIDNFRLNGGSEDPNWSVTLNRSSDWAATGGITGPTSDATVWSINGAKATASGSWSGVAYDEAPDDGSNLPTTVLGKFYSEFDSSHRMVGAFGATKDN